MKFTFWPNHCSMAQAVSFSYGRWCSLQGRGGGSRLSLEDLHWRFFLEDLQKQNYQLGGCRSNSLFLLLTDGYSYSESLLVVLRQECPLGCWRSWGRLSLHCSGLESDRSPWFEQVFKTDLSLWCNMWIWWDELHLGLPKDKLYRNKRRKNGSNRASSLPLDNIDADCKKIASYLICPLKRFFSIDVFTEMVFFVTPQSFKEAFEIFSASFSRECSIAA